MAYKPEGSHQEGKKATAKGEEQNRVKSRVLTNWQPSRLDVKTITLELQVLLGTMGFLTSLPEVRTPGWDKNHDDLGWHQDNNGLPLSLVVWSHRFPTEVRFKNNRMLQARDGDVILIDNERTFHRTPAKAERLRRWFARLSVISYQDKAFVDNCRTLATDHEQRNPKHRVSRIEPEFFYICRDCEWEARLRS